MGEITQFAGLSELGQIEQDAFNTLSTKYLEKIKRIIYNISSIHMHIKQYKKTDSAPKYSLHIKVSIPGKVFEVEKTDWDISKVIHLCFEALINEIQHYLGSENSKFMKKDSKNQ
jgi:hypothetical protein